MYVIINVAGDPTSWWTMSFASGSALAAQLAQGPVNVPVFYPVIGNLLLSPAGSVSVFDVPPTVSWIPSGVQVPVATLYVQASPPATHLPGYTLPAGTDLESLAGEIMSAMKEPASRITVAVHSGPYAGSTLLNGATLTFAMICPPPPAKP